MPSTTVCLEHVQVHDVCGLQHYVTGSLGAPMSHWSYQGHELAFVLETGSQGCGLATPSPCEDASLLHAMSIGLPEWMQGLEELASPSRPCKDLGEPPSLFVEPDLCVEGLITPPWSEHSFRGASLP